MLPIEHRAQAFGGGFAGRVAIKPERFGKGRAKQGIANRLEHEPQGRVRDMMFFVTHGEASDQAADRIEDRIQGVAVAGQNHPRGERPGPLAAERVEGHVDDVAGIALTGPGGLDRLGDAAGDALGDRPGELGLKPCGRAEMVEQIGMGAADLGGDRLQRHGLGPVGQQQAARGLERD